MRRSLAVCFGLACALAVPLGPAAAQMESREGIALQNQILELRHELDGMRVGRGGGAGGSVLGGAGATQLTPPPASSSSGSLEVQLLDRVQRVEQGLRELRGRLDDADNTRQQQYDALNKKIDDLAFKIDSGTAAPPRAAAAAPAAAAVAAAPPAAAVRRTPELILQDGNAALTRREYATAEADAHEVLAAKGTHTTDAQFLLAQALAGKKDYSGAAVAYDDAYNRSRTGIHAPDSLLGLANALIAINEKRAACETLEKLRGEFPNPRADLKEPIATARHGAACK